MQAFPRYWPFIVCVSVMSNDPHRGGIVLVGSSLIDTLVAYLFNQCNGLKKRNIQLKSLNFGYKIMKSFDSRRKRKDCVFMYSCGSKLLPVPLIEDTNALCLNLVQKQVIHIHCTMVNDDILAAADVQP